MKEHLELFFQNPWSYLFGLILLGLFYYFKKKMENLADKDDIAGITREVETVKENFNVNLEKVKSNLEIIKSHNINLVNEKRKIIYEFWIHLNDFDNKLNNFLGANIKTEREMIDFNQELDRTFQELGSKKSLLNLILNVEINNDTEDLIKKVYSIFSNKEIIVRTSLYKIIVFHESDNIDMKELGKLFNDAAVELKEKNILMTESLNNLKEQLGVMLKELHIIK